MTIVSHLVEEAQKRIREGRWDLAALHYEGAAQEAERIAYQLRLNAAELKGESITRLPQRQES